jgi:cholesterol oxidase
MQEETFDYIVIGSGFGGSVSAMRLSEKGYSVAVLEKGKRFQAKDFPKTNWDIKKFLWAPIIKCFGFQKLTFFREVFILSGVGVGGGSLVYANTHMIPSDTFFNNPSWSKFGNWKERLMPFYDVAKFMLGTVKNEKLYEEDFTLRELARDMGREHTFDSVNVGVYFGDTKNFTDPYFKGLGPQRKGCIECAGCMVGCRHDAKNTLDKNYLWFAEKFGTKVFAETLVTKIEFKDEHYFIHTEDSTSWLGKKKRIFKSKGLVMSGGVLGTMDLLLKQKYATQTLPNLSDTLGEQIRTNSESLCGVHSYDKKLNNGIAISSVFNPDDNTHIEVVKYSDGADVMGTLSTYATGPGSGPVRTMKLIGNFITNPQLIGMLIKRIIQKKWAKHTIIFLVMQSLDSSMKMVWKKGLFGGSIGMQNEGNQKVPSYIEIGQQVMTDYAKKINGVPANAITEVVFNMSTTAHILGGVPMGSDATEGVVNEKFEVHGYPNMYILDGSIVQGNLGVNPSLTITALSEYAMSLIPDKKGVAVTKLSDQLAEINV